MLAAATSFVLSCSAPDDDGNGGDAGAATEDAASTADAGFDASDPDEGGDADAVDAADAAATDSPLSWSLEADGPFRVGHRTFDVAYEPIPGVTREITVHVWYPTEDRDGTPARYGNFTDVKAFADAALADSVYDGGYPVHLHSHGRQGFGAASADIVKRFVTHGWVGVAPDHTHDLLVDAQMPLSVPIYYRRLLDLRQSLDLLETLETDDPLHGRALTGDVLLSGHSLGAFLAWGAAGATFDEDDVRAKCAGVDAEAEMPCTEADIAAFADVADPRIGALVPMAGILREDWYTEDAHRSVEIGVLTLTGTKDPVGQEEQWDRLDGIRHTWIDFAGVCHLLFSVGVCADVERPDGLRAITAYALAFGRAELLGDTTDETTSLLDGTRRLEPDLVATFERR